MNLSIMTACFPYMKPFLESLESGMIRSDDLLRRQGGGTFKYGRGYPLGPISDSSSKTSKARRDRGENVGGIAAPNIMSKTPVSLSAFSKDGPENLGSGRNGIGNQFENVAVITADTGKDGEADVESQSSQSRIIKQTTAWTVSRERR